jgi:hypothetical protein
MTVWIFAACLGLAFSANPWFIGTGASLLGGIDIGFAVAGVVAGVVYPIVLRVWPEPASVYASDDPRSAGAIPVPVYKK